MQIFCDSRLKLELEKELSSYDREDSEKLWAQNLALLELNSFEQNIGDCADHLGPIFCQRLDLALQTGIHWEYNRNMQKIQ